MKQIIKSALIVTLALIMAVSSLIIVSAEDIAAADDETVITASITDTDGTRAYQLVWKYKSENGHLYRRRWNMTLGEWYDPAWILVE